MYVRQIGLLSLPAEVYTYIFKDLRQVDLYNLLFVSPVFYDNVCYTLYQAPRLARRTSIYQFFETLCDKRPYASHVQSVHCSLETSGGSLSEVILFEPPINFKRNGASGDAEPIILPNCRTLCITSSAWKSLEMSMADIVRWTRAVFPRLLSLDITFNSIITFRRPIAEALWGFPESLRSLTLRDFEIIGEDDHGLLWDMCSPKLRVMSLGFFILRSMRSAICTPQPPRGHAVTHFHLYLKARNSLPDIPLMFPNLKWLQIGSEAVTVWTRPFQHLEHFSLNHGYIFEDDLHLSARGLAEAFGHRIFPVLRSFTLTGHTDSPDFHSFSMVADEEGLVDTCKTHGVQLHLVEDAPKFDFSNVTLE